MVKDAKVQEILAESQNLDEATTWLVNEANEAGGRDNITVVAFRLAEGEAQEVDEGATLVGPTAAGAGLSAETVRAEAERRRAASLGGAASGAPPRRREPAETKRKRRFPVKSLVALIVVAGVLVAGFFAARGPVAKAAASRTPATATNVMVRADWFMSASRFGL